MNANSPCNTLTAIAGIALLACCFNIHAMATPPPSQVGQVTLTLAEYRQLLERATDLPMPTPSSYAIGMAKLDMRFEEIDARVTATITATLEVETFTDDWTLVPLLGPGAALGSANVDGQPVRLVQRADGLYWLSDHRTTATLTLVYHADAHFSERAYITSIPTPKAAATAISIHIPQQDIDLAIAPISNLKKTQSAGATLAQGTLPTTDTVTITWRIAPTHPYVLSRAEYQGEITGEAVTWRANLQAEAFVDGEIEVPLLHTGVTLLALKVDDAAAPIHVLNNRFSARLTGLGNHRIELVFQSALSYPDGVPATNFRIPQVPVSHFALRLPGAKLIQVKPSTAVDLDHVDGHTHATFFTPLGETVALSWSEAIPSDVAVERRANASVYQALHAAEGVLYGRAAIEYEITRGEANALDFDLPQGTQVNRISAASATIADWVELETSDDGRQAFRVFLNRPISGVFVLQAEYELLLDASETEAPLLHAIDVSRQNGMLALLANAELALAPLQHTDMAEVGENQLPAFFRNQLEQSISHTYKYHSDGAQLGVAAVPPKRAPSKFNAQIDTLISVGEVTLKGQTSIENDVKSGLLKELNVRLPGNINVLGVNGPSIRAQRIAKQGDTQTIHIEFTQEMEGRFRVELHFERIMTAATAATMVPQIEVLEADVEHGRIAIEALAALEVQASQVDRLSNLEITELPKQLLLKTTNPILLAYKYVRADQPFALGLRITRHQEIEVQVAAIDTARYQTLYTDDGLTVTKAHFEVRNSRRQFLRLGLPADTSIWSVFVNGQAQKPAFASDAPDGPRDILIKMINSDNAFPVELIYATQGGAMGMFGELIGNLPRLDMIVTHSQWDVYVPSGPQYSHPHTNMNWIAQPITDAMDTTLEQLRAGFGNAITGPLRIDLPTQGRLFRFGKLYANQSIEPARFSLPYIHSNAHRIGLWLSLLATVAIWTGIFTLRSHPSRWFGRTLIGVGGLTMTLAIGILEAPMIPAAVLALVIGVLFGISMFWPRLRRPYSQDA